jgi:hypothetical protein
VALKDDTYEERAGHIPTSTSTRSAPLPGVFEKSVVDPKLAT